MKRERLSPREKRLAWAVGIVVFVLLNIVLLSTTFRAQVRLRSELRSKANDLATLRLLSGEAGLWEQRDAWLNTVQTKLANPDEAGVKLLERVKEAASRQGILVENPALGTVERSPNHISVPVSIETKSSWDALISFLAAMQAPQQFIVFETANLQVDPQDASRMRGRFRVAQWFAPQGGGG